MAKNDRDRHPGTPKVEWGTLDLVRLRRGLPQLRKRLARLERAKIVTRKTLKSEISV